MNFPHIPRTPEGAITTLSSFAKNKADNLNPRAIYTRSQTEAARQNNIQAHVWSKLGIAPEAIPASAQNKPFRVIIVDAQISFMDMPGSSLPVTGASKDMDRLGNFIKQTGLHISEIDKTKDKHKASHVGNAQAWEKTSDGGATWTRLEDAMHPLDPKLVVADGGMAPTYRLQDNHNLGIEYAQRLLEGGTETVMLWPKHCISGTQGYKTHPGLKRAIDEARSDFAFRQTTLAKGQGKSEQYSFNPLVRMNNDPYTAKAASDAVFDRWDNGEMVVFAGEAGSHCLKGMVEDYIGHLESKYHDDQDTLAEKLQMIVVLKDCTNPVQAPLHDISDSDPEAEQKRAQNAETEAMNGVFRANQQAFFDKVENGGGHVVATGPLGEPMAPKASSQRARIFGQRQT